MSSLSSSLGATFSSDLKKFIDERKRSTKKKKRSQGDVKEISKEEHLRSKVIDEILMTEFSYLRQVETLVNVSFKTFY